MTIRALMKQKTTIIYVNIWPAVHASQQLHLACCRRVGFSFPSGKACLLSAHWRY